MYNLEFFKDPNGKDLLFKSSENKVLEFNETCTDIVNSLIDIIKEDYPEAYESLREIYSKSFNFKFLLVRRFINCNLSLSDTSSLDVCEGRINIELIPCPLRCECKWEGIICNPHYNTNLSKRLEEVGELFAEGYKPEEIADKLYISIFTVINHKKKIFKKLGFKTEADLVRFFKNK
jgi:DNA-binding CsgD family transcriptional regulator